MRRAADAARAGRRGLLQAQDPLDLPELGVGVLEHGCALDDHVDADPVADRHLVDEPAEVELELGDARRQLIAAPLQIDEPRRLAVAGPRAADVAVAARARPGQPPALQAPGQRARGTSDAGSRAPPPAVLKGLRIVSGSVPEEVAGELAALAAGAPPCTSGAGWIGRRREAS